MLTHPNRTLIKNRTFRVVFMLGIASTIIGGILNIIVNASTGVCVGQDYCLYNDYNHVFTCVEGGQLYCCNSYSSGTDYYSCGSYYRSCNRKGSGYEYCGDGLYVGMWICGCFSLGCLVSMIVLASMHKSRVLREAMAAINQPYVPPSGDNVIFTDSNRPHEHQNRPYQQNRVVIEEQNRVVVDRQPVYAYGGQHYRGEGVERQQQGPYGMNNTIHSSQS